MKQMLQIFINYLKAFLNSMSTNLKKVENYLNNLNISDLTLIRITPNTLGRNKSFILNNNNLFYCLASYKADSNRARKNLFYAIYLFLMNHQKFLDFGEHKIIIVNGIIKDDVFNLHHNILIRNRTPFDQYWDKIKDIISNRYDEGYSVEGIPMIEINVWDMDLLANKKIKIIKNALTGEEIIVLSNIKLKNTSPLSAPNRSLPSNRFYSTNNLKKENANNKYLNYITPIKPKKSFSKIINIGAESKPFSAMVIETMDFKDPHDKKNKEVPISISIRTKNNSKIFIIDPVKLMKNLDLALDELWNQFFDFILVNCGGSSPKNTIFVHNLGEFYGLFIFKALSNKFEPNQVSCLIDSHNKFIQITLTIKKIKIIWKDSYRIFPVSLDDLCNMLSLPGKSSKYKSEFHNLTLFKNSSLLEEFKIYSLSLPGQGQDSDALFNCLIKLQEMYLNNYKVDITSILSTSTLSLKIFRKNFLKVNIPILKRRDDTFLRNAYFGGATDYYQMKAFNIKYYDVNSLYPHNMCKPMPFDLIRKFIIKSDFNLDDFFGFLKVEVNCPKSVKIPVLPCKYNGKTIFPTGNWTGTYFSEELRAVLKYGYKFKFLEAYEFSKEELFTDYVNDFFFQKSNSTGPQRFLAKMHLNQLYGIFGRKQDLLETVNIYKEDLVFYALTRVIKAVIPINDKIVALLMHKNINYELIKKLNSTLNMELNNYQYLIKANVAIASAVTSYSRVHMIPYKVSGLCVYSDTDSAFMTEALPDEIIGKGLGQMKDELDGLIIKEAYFLGNKKYGYQYIDPCQGTGKSGNLITKTVFAGIERDSLTFEEIIKLSQGHSLMKEIPLRFYKSLKNLNISIDSTHVTISRSLDKPLINNKYIPLHLNLIPSDTNSNSFYNYLKRKILTIIKLFTF